MAEEQGWIARMVHLFRSDNLDTQFEVSDVAVVVIMGVDCVLVVTNSKATFRLGRRADTLYLPCAHHRGHKALQAIQDARTYGAFSHLMSSSDWC